MWNKAYELLTLLRYSQFQISQKTNKKDRKHSVFGLFPWCARRGVKPSFVNRPVGPSLGVPSLDTANSDASPTKPTGGHKACALRTGQDGRLWLNTLIKESRHQNSCPLR